MLRLTFAYAVAYLALGAGAALVSRTHDTSVIARSAFFFGGAVLICAFFAVRNRIHGLSGAAFLSFLSTLTGIGAVGSQLQAGQFDLATLPSRFLLGISALSTIYLLIAIRAYRKARHTRLMRELHGDE